MRNSTTITWRRHQMETFSALLAICAGNSPVPGEFPAQRPVTRSFDVFFDLRLNKRLSKQSWGWWFETLSRPLWRHRNAFNAYKFHTSHFLTFHIYANVKPHMSLWKTFRPWLYSKLIFDQLQYSQWRNFVTGVSVKVQCAMQKGIFFISSHFARQVSCGIGQQVHKYVIKIHEFGICEYRVIVRSPLWAT